MTITINRFRMSLFWNMPFVSLIQDNLPANAPLSALGKPETYQRIFNSLLASPNDPLVPLPDTEPALALPWPPQASRLLATHKFWRHYLSSEGITPQRLDGKFAFFRLVPLRRRHSPLTGLSVTFNDNHVTVEGGGVISESILTEAWFHPHMVSFAIHFNICGEMPLETAGRVCISLRNERLIAVDGGGLRTLDELATESLDALFKEAVGEANVVDIPFIKPFSIVTVLQGDGINPYDQVAPGDAVHQFLETVTQWDPIKCDPLDTGRISSHPPSSITGHLLFGRGRSRAFWQPSKFLPKGNGKSALSSYHRNLFLSSLQTEALLAFAGLANEEALRGNRPKSIRDCELNVLERLIALYKAKPEQTRTYWSMNLQRLIDGSPYRDAVNAIAVRRGRTERLPSPVVSSL